MSKEFCKQAFPKTNLIAATEDLFGEDILEKHIVSLLNSELSNYSFANTEPALCDKWLAVSSLHKSIRRGEVKTAFQATSTLLSLDPAYLIKRLQIIVFEDIGIANPSLCLLTLLASSKRLHNVYGRDKVIHYLIEKMAKSAKSRNATDIYCFTLSDPDAANYLHCCLNTPVQRLVTVALDTSLYITHRMAALKVISGFSERHSNGYHRTISKARLDLLGQICEAMSLPEVLIQAVLLGNTKTAGLNAAMLLAFEMLMEATNTQIKDDILHNNEYQGINLAALDIYCRSGRQVISDFLAASKLLKQFFTENPNKNPNRLVGTVLFIIEGSLLNREFIFTGSQSIKNQIELMEIQSAGLKTKEAAIKLIDLINKEMPLLQQIRAAHIDVTRG